MKRLWIITSLTLLSCLPISVRADSVEGKAIICSRALDGSDERDTYFKIYRPSGMERQGFKFYEDQGVERYILWVKDLDATVGPPPGGALRMGKRREYAESIDWLDSLRKQFVLDRKTLTLTYGDYPREKSYTCEVFNNFAEFDAAFEVYRQKEQELNDKKMKGNKI